MKLFSELKRVARQLSTCEGRWAVCGGVAASLYRESPRFTGDIDIAVIDAEGDSARTLAERVLRELGYRPALGFVPNPSGGGAQTMALLIGRGDMQSTFIGINFLLPIFPWVPTAVARAQSNLVDYGFSRLPTLTVEDMIVAKLCALRSSPARIQDKDDILSMLGFRPIDAQYIARQARTLGIPLPHWVKARF